MAIEKLEDGTKIIHRQDGKKEYIFQKIKKLCEHSIRKNIPSLTTR